MSYQEIKEEEKANDVIVRNLYVQEDIPGLTSDGTVPVCVVRCCLNLVDFVHII